MARMLLSQLKKGEDYSSLNRTVTINILNFNYIDFINEQDNMEVLKSWNKIAVIAESLDEFQ